MSQRRCPSCGRGTASKRRYCDSSCAREHVRRRAHELADEARETLDPTTSGYPLTAEHPGTCPLCAGYIAAGRSRIVALATPTFPVVALFDRDGSPKRRIRRTWTHLSCLDRLTTTNEGDTDDD